MPLKQLSISSLSLGTLSEDTPVPLYHQIELDLRRLIAMGQLKPDDILPPEHELCRAYAVGRHTVRMALARLVADGLIERQAGRGTFVKAVSDKQEFHLDRSFTRHLADMGIQAHSRVLRAWVGLPHQALPKPLQGRTDANYFCLDRLRLGGDEPIGLQSTAVIADLCPGIETFDFGERSLYDVLATVYKLEITQITHSISAVIADAQQASLLQVLLSSPLLLVKTTAYLDTDQIIEFTISYYRADKYEYSTIDAYPHTVASKTRLSPAR